MYTQGAGEAPTVPACHPCVTLDDLIGAGTIGLIQAVDRFPAIPRTVPVTYAKHRIRGAMLDFLREEDPPANRNGAGPERQMPPPKGLCPRQSAWNSFPAQEARICTGTLLFNPFPRIVMDLSRARCAFLSARTESFSVVRSRTGRTVTLHGKLGVNESRGLQIKQRHFQSLLRSHLQPAPVILFWAASAARDPAYTALKSPMT